MGYRGFGGVMKLRGGKGADKVAVKHKARKTAQSSLQAMEDESDPDGSARPRTQDWSSDSKRGSTVAADTVTTLAKGKLNKEVAPPLHSGLTLGSAPMLLQVAQDMLSRGRDTERVMRKRLDEGGSGWATVKGKRVRKTGIDWDTWQRKRKVNPEDLANSAVAPYEGRGPMLYQDVFGFSGKRVHRKVIRDSWNQMTLEEINDKCERDAEAYLKALELNAEVHYEHLATPPVNKKPQSTANSWKQHLLPQVKAIIDAEANGLHFTGRLGAPEERRDGALIRMPTFTNSTWRANLVTGLPERIPGAASPSTLSIAEQEKLFRYVRDGQVPHGGPQHALLLVRTKGSLALLLVRAG